MKHIYIYIFVHVFTQIDEKGDVSEGGAHKPRRITNNRSTRKFWGGGWRGENLSVEEKEE